MDEPIASVSTTASETETADAGSLRHRDGLQPFLEDLIRRQCLLIQAKAGVAMIRPTRDEPTGASARFLSDPDVPLSPKQYKRLAEIATQAVRENQSMVQPMTSDSGLLSTGPEYHVLAAPMRVAGQPQGASVCIVGDESEADIRERLTRLELSGILLEAHMWRKQAYAEAESKIQLRESLDLLDKANQGHSTREMASLFAHELQRRFACDRVSIGLVNRHDIKVWAISGSEDVDKKSELVEALEGVMEECADQDVEIRSPQPEDIDVSERRVVRAHMSLSERYGPSAIASFPLRVDGGLIGVVVMERSIDDPFNDASLRLLRLIAEYIGPSLWTRRMADRGVLAVTRDRAIDAAHYTVGPEKTGAKMFALIALILLILTIVIPVPDRVVAPARMVAEVQRQVSPPFRGVVYEVKVKPGDVVVEGQELVILDTRETDLELRERQNELGRLMTEADEARAGGEIARANMISSRIAGTQADIELLEFRLARSILVAPIDGVVTLGDLEDIEGKVVEPTEPLLMIAQVGDMTATALVPERGITRVRESMEGSLAMNARPGDRLNFAVRTITPASEVVDQQNIYRVELELEDPPDWLRPGMEGQVRIRGDRSCLFVIYTRPLIDAVRMRFWWW